MLPEFQAVTLTSGMLGLTWTIEVGGTYQLQYNSDLSSSNGTSLGSPITATGATFSTNDSRTNGTATLFPAGARAVRIHHGSSICACADHRLVTRRQWQAGGRQHDKGRARTGAEGKLLCLV